MIDINNFKYTLQALNFQSQGDILFRYFAINKFYSKNLLQINAITREVFIENKKAFASSIKATFKNIEKIAQGGSGKIALNISKNIKILLFSISEQLKIVAQLEKLEKTIQQHQQIIDLSANKKQQYYI